MKNIGEYIKKHVSLSGVTVLILFFAFLPWISKVNFMQNDDWNRTTSVLRFMQGDFSLLNVTATTFYVQGILGVFFSFIFGWTNLPFLTFTVSVLNFYVFSQILIKQFKLSEIKSILISLILFFNPLHIYSAIGFMTENYTLFFVLLSIYFLFQYEKDKKSKNFLLFNIAGLLSFFTKQNGIIINFAYIPYLVIKKRYKEALIQFLIIGGLFAYYFIFFPRTAEMLDKGFTVNNFLDFEYAYSLIYGILLVSVSFIFPFVVNFVGNTVMNNRKNIIKLLFVFSFAILLFVIMNKYFVPSKLAWEEYPYFENTFERTGFFPRSIHGTKYYFKWNYDIFKYWDLGSKITLALLLPCLILSWKKLINLYSISIVGYLILMIFTQHFFDRYILLLLPLFILFLISIQEKKPKLKSFSSVIEAIFLVFTLILSCQFAADFILTNNYIWEKSENLVESGELPSNIKSTMAWERLHGTVQEPKILFSFDSPKKAPEILDSYDLVEKKKIDYRGNIFVEPYVYLYKRDVITQ